MDTKTLLNVPRLMGRAEPDVTTHCVTVTNIDISFTRMVELMVKAAFALIPAGLIVAAIVYTVITLLIGKHV